MEHQPSHHMCFFPARLIRCLLCVAVALATTQTQARTPHRHTLFCMIVTMATLVSLHPSDLFLLLVLVFAL